MNLTILRFNWKSRKSNLEHPHSSVTLITMLTSRDSQASKCQYFIALRVVCIVTAIPQLIDTRSYRFAKSKDSFSQKVRLLATKLLSLQQVASEWRAKPVQNYTLVVVLNNKLFVVLCCLQSFDIRFCADRFSVSGVN